MRLSSDKKDLLKLTGAMSLVHVVGRALVIPSSLITARLLGPSLLGVYGLMGLIRKYTSYTNLGVTYCLNRDLPMAYGREDWDEAALIKNVIFTDNMIAALLAFVLVWTVYFCGITLNGMLTKDMVFMLSIIVVLANANAFFKKLAKGEKKFMVLTRIRLATNVLIPLLDIPGVVFLGLRGLLLAEIIRDSVSVGMYIVLLGWPRMEIALNRSKTRALIQTGFMIFANSMADSLFWGLDLMILAVMLSNTEVGLYKIALMPFFLATVFAEPLNITINRSIMVKAGKHGARNHALVNSLTNNTFVLYVMFNYIIIGVGILGYIMLLRLFLHEYLASIDVVLILCFGYMVYTGRLLPSFYMNASGQLLPRLVVVFVGMAVNAALDYLLIIQGYGLAGVALACSVSFVLISSIIMGFSFCQLCGTMSAATGLILRIMTLSVLNTGFLVTLYNWTGGAGAMDASFGNILRLAIVFLLCSGAYAIFSCLSGCAVFAGVRPWNDLKALGIYLWNVISTRIKHVFSRPSCC